MDVDALAAGLKSGAADAIMFPDDPLGDAALIVSELDAWFPIADGSFVFGIAAQITWGTKALVTAELGIVHLVPGPRHRRAGHPHRRSCPTTRTRCSNCTWTRSG